MDRISNLPDEILIILLHCIFLLCKRGCSESLYHHSEKENVEFGDGAEN